MPVPLYAGGNSTWHPPDTTLGGSQFRSWHCIKEYNFLPLQAIGSWNFCLCTVF